MPTSSAASITIRATLALLDGAKREIANGVCNDQYAFWLGSGISREKAPDLRDLAKQVLIGLQLRIDQANDDCRFREALTAVVALARPSLHERSRIDFATGAATWPDLDSLADRLVQNYARMLAVTPEGESADFLLWDLLDAPQLYADPSLAPDAEHLCLAALAIEGVASEMATANWDPLVERAMSQLAGSQPVMRVVVAPEDIRSSRRRANLYKFHGCAQSALDDEARFRPLLVARQNQLHGWAADNPVMAPFLTNLIVTKATLMLGLSAQDSNIQGLFSSARAMMAWPWPSHPPAYAFSEESLGADQEGLLQNVYHVHYTPSTKRHIKDEALVQAYAKPLLVSLFLHVVTAKLKVLVSMVLPLKAVVDRDVLHLGLEQGRDALADVLVPDAASVLEMLQHGGRALTMFRDGRLPSADDGSYSALTATPLDGMLADATLLGSGICHLAVASGLIGLGLGRGNWTASAADVSRTDSGALLLTSRSGKANVYFVSGPHASILLKTSGVLLERGDTVVIYSHENPAAMARYPRRAPGRTGLVQHREVSMEALLAEGTEVEDLMERFRSKVAL